MKDTYVKDGAIYSRVAWWDEATGKTVNYYPDGSLILEVIGIYNEIPVQCESCRGLIASGNAQSTGGNAKTGKITSWICNRCESREDRIYQAMTFDADYRDSMAYDY